MDPNTHSTGSPGQRPPAPPDGLEALTAAVEALAVQDRQGLTDAARAERVLGLRRLLDRLEGLWLQELAALDARGAAGADQDQEMASTAAWLRNRLRLSASMAHSSVHTARALFRGSLPQTAAALCAGVISPAHARVVADGTRDLPEHLKLEAEPVLVETARRVDPPGLRQAVDHLVQVADPGVGDRKAERCHERRGGVVVADLAGHGGHRRAAGGRSREHPRGGPGAVGPARPTPTTRAPVASATLMRWPSWPAGRWRAGGCPRPVGSAPSCW
jgi:Domain of unknown function (DUF222)